MTQRKVLIIDAGHQTFDELNPADVLSAAMANIPAVGTGGLILLSDVITALGTLQASHNSLLAKLKTAGLMVAD